MRTLLIVLALTTPAAHANTAHAPQTRTQKEKHHTCRTHACWRRVHAGRARRWCRSHYWRCERARIPEPVRGELALLRWCESRDDYQAVNGQYTGAYQYSASTWARAGGSGEAMYASDAEQDVRTARFYPTHRGEWSCSG